jgi:predicted HNH restriction endonuclease
MDEETHLQEYGCRLHIHHKTPSRSFENAEQGNTLKNLVALCAACHQVAEAMAPLYPFAD